jgi:uncharacterized metal-binding protein YceD (DUF177 family)
MTIHQLNEQRSLEVNEARSLREKLEKLQREVSRLSQSNSKMVNLEINPKAGAKVIAEIQSPASMTVGPIAPPY